MASSQATLALDHKTIIVRIPISIKRRSGRKQIVAPTEGSIWSKSSSKISGALLGALVRAHHWRRSIEEGQFSSATDLARAQKINESYLCRNLRLTLLAPDIVEAILNGKQPADLELKTLQKPFPSDWQLQRKLFGFAPHIIDERRKKDGT